MPEVFATSTASSVSTKVGFTPAWKVSTICTTSFLPRCIGSGSVIILSHAGVAWRRPCGSWPMFGAPPKPERRPRVTVEELARPSTCRVEPMNISTAYWPASWQKARLERIEPSGPVKKISGRARMYSSIPSSPPKQCTLSTQPLSIAGISVGCGFRVQCLQILPFRPSCSP